MKSYLIVILSLICISCSPANNPQPQPKELAKPKVAGSEGVQNSINLSGTIKIPKEYSVSNGKEIFIQGSLTGKINSIPHPSKPNWSILTSKWVVDATTKDGNSGTIKINFETTTEYSGQPSEGYALSFGQLWKAVSKEVKFKK